MMKGLYRHKGFSLLEILIAFSILAVSLSILLKIFSSGVNTAVVAEEYTLATQIAESLMAKTGVETPLLEGEDADVEMEKYYWQVTVEKLTAPISEEKSAIELMAVQVVVRWGGDINPRTIELNTIKARQK